MFIDAIHEMIKERQLLKQLSYFDRYRIHTNARKLNKLDWDILRRESINQLYI